MNISEATKLSSKSSYVWNNLSTYQPDDWLFVLVGLFLPLVILICLASFILSYICFITPDEPEFEMDEISEMDMRRSQINSDI